MKVTRSDSEKLVIVEFPWPLGVFLLLMGLASLGYLLTGPDDLTKNDEIALYIVVGLLFLGSAYVTKKSVFEFDLRLRQLKWSRVSLFGRTGATLAFEQITGVKVESTPDDGSTTYWVTLITTEGDLPLAKQANYGGQFGCTILCNAINRVLGLPELPEDQIGEEAIRGLIANGLKIHAIKLTRQLRHCGLAEAKGIVESMMKTE